MAEILDNNAPPKGETLIGRKFSRLEVISFAGRKRDKYGVPKKQWNCLCKCGNMVVVIHGHLKNNNTRSCGCLQVDTVSTRKTTHGASKSNSVKKRAIYSSWNCMRRRCNNQNVWDYKYYGGRGISVDPAWDDFSVFYDEMESTWSEGLTIDRINPYSNYGPNLCKWSTHKQQMNNQRFHFDRRSSNLDKTSITS